MSVNSHIFPVQAIVSGLMRTYCVLQCNSTVIHRACGQEHHHLSNPVLCSTMLSALKALLVIYWG